MRYAIELLSKECIHIIYYLDDICVLTRSKKNELNHARVKTDFEALVFVINVEKLQKYLGFQFNTKKMQISVPITKINNLLKRIK
jgi:hypothetical protein